MIICIVGLPCSGKTYLSKTIGKWFRDSDNIEENRYTEYEEPTLFKYLTMLMSIVNKEKL